MGFEQEYWKGYNYSTKEWSDLPLEDIKILIKIYEDRIRSLELNSDVESNVSKLVEYRNSLKSLRYAYRRKDFHSRAGVWDNNQIKEKAIRYLHFLGFSDCVYIEDAKLLVDRLVEDFDDLSKYRKLGYDTIAGVICYEILSHYNVEFDYNDLIEYFSIEGDKLSRLYIRLQDWFREEFWK